MKKVVLILALSISLSFSAQEKIKGSGNIITEKRTIQEYSSISISGSFDVHLFTGKEGNISITGEENIVKLIVTEIKDGILKIHFEKNHNISYKHKLTVNVPFEKINELFLTGSGNVTSTDPITEDLFKVKLSGSGDLKIILNTRDATANLSGSGNLTLEGTTTNLDVSLSGSGDISSLKLVSESTIAKLSGSGDITVNTTKYLKATVNGSGEIKYKGNPSNVDKKVIGSGDVSKI